DGGQPLPGTVLRLSGSTLVPVVGGFQHPDGIVARKDGSLLVAAQGYRVGRPRTNGSVFAVGPTGAVTLRLAAAVDEPGGLVEDVTGAFFVAGTRDDDHDEHHDSHHDHDGDRRGAIVRGAPEGSASDLATRLRQPAGLALAGNGDLVAADADAGIV